ncbi:bifunctional hydroxymethylpyrimidine kinase/phosphomethylpyrimidine kinase [Teredinibacter franksiae]|uniref:bifunctional hydroxymethylpyrimidine kinase/phosphomethylpyrimidine kinase n=1 Tax=Teredinibacter franksiae TaxID=2761453 RepID=UPI0035E4254D
MIDASGVTSFESAYVNTRWNHGTGCTYASAITAAAAQHYPLEDAVVIAKACMQQALENSYTLLSEDTQHTTQTVEFGTTQPQACQSQPPICQAFRKNNDTQAFPL